ncbi:acyltransferase family protein [Listeria weihenstephanensis]|uniref:Acyltransferase family protein n=1 Tax=Listeria weihenstephanensis TaxID=1006155 RepID=A0A841Z3N7_9LIST|nr:acyltransferase family protein [Listeria weihenstephanensis]MBC1499818.1 acyltransferase family protein [Listeria weihenstephanensis]
MNQRLIWIDNLKAYGIILVVIGHCVVLSADYPYTGLLMKLIYSFHMPLFFFISGFLFRGKGTGKYFYKKWKTLLVPYFIFQVISVLFINSFYYVTAGQLERDPLSTLLSVFYLNGNVGWNAPLWFLVVLFILDVLYYFFSKWSERTGIQMALVLLSCVVGWLLSETGIKFPFGLQIVFSCFLFYYLGNMTKKYNVLKLLSRSLVVYMLLLTLAGSFLIGSMFWLNGPRLVSMYDNYFGTNYILFVLTALSGIVFSVLLFQMVQKVGVFTVFGKEAIILIGTQYFVLLGFDGVCRVIGIYSPDVYYLIIKVIAILAGYVMSLYVWEKIRLKREVVIE